MVTSFRPVSSTFVHFRPKGVDELPPEWTTFFQKNLLESEVI
jgi:hypothetical protein